MLYGLRGGVSLLLGFNFEYKLGVVFFLGIVFVFLGSEDVNDFF